MPINTIDDFLKHRTSERGGEYLNDWKKRNPPRVDTWLHRKRMPCAVWHHPFPNLVVRDVDGETKTQVWTGQFNCWEKEDVLRAQYFRNDDGTRKKPPTRCPQCRLIEVVGDMIDEGQLDWLEPIFRFEGDDDTVLIHAGGLCGLFKSDDLSDEDKRAVKEAGIKLWVPDGSKERAGWTQNGYAKCSYLFCVVDNSDIEKGVQKALVTSLLGNRVQDVMNDAIASLGSEEGNPFLNPYAIQWEYRKQEQEFSKKYKARRMEKLQLTPEIEALISGDPPDISRDIAPFNMATHRAYLEKHALVKLDWDYIFDVDVPKEERGGSGEAAGEFPPAETKSKQNGNPGSRRVAAKPQPAPDPNACPECGKTEAQGCPHVACDECDAAILETDAKCKHCGHVYREEQPQPPPAGRRKRSSVTPSETGNKPPFAR